MESVEQTVILVLQDSLNVLIVLAGIIAIYVLLEKLYVLMGNADGVVGAVAGEELPVRVDNFYAKTKPADQIVTYVLLEKPCVKMGSAELIAIFVLQD